MVNPPLPPPSSSSFSYSAPLAHTCPPTQFHSLTDYIQSVSIPSSGGRREGKVTRLSSPAGAAGAADGGGAGAAGQMTSRRAGGRKPGGKTPLRVVVDLREFRSVLPNLLHQVRGRTG